MLEDAIRRCRDAAKEFYWKQKDLVRARIVLEAGIRLAEVDGNLAEQKAMNYDLASFCWPGWDEAGIVLSADDLAAGERAARENLRLAIDLRRDAGPMANAWFMIGAYHLVAEEYGEAQAAFEKQWVFAEAKGEADGVLLAEGYGELARLLRGEPNDFEYRIASLRNLEKGYGAEFAEQLQTAARVFDRAEAPCPGTSPRSWGERQE